MTDYCRDEDYLYWTRNGIHTKPVAVSLCVIRDLDGIARLEGRTKGAFVGPPFYLRTASGEHICRATALHEYARVLLDAVEREVRS